MKFLASTLLLALLAVQDATAFVQSQPKSQSTNSKTARFMEDSATNAINYDPEKSRSYRRTVYTHDDWVKHRSPDRFIKNLVNIPSSGIYKVS
jgi:hypothetical protein